MSGPAVATTPLPSRLRPATARELEGLALDRMRVHPGGPGGAAGGSLNVSIDLTKIRALRAALLQVGDEFANDPQPLVRGINEGVDRMWTRLRRDLQQWTGLQTQHQLWAAVRVRHAGARRLEGGISFPRPWTRITGGDFGARYSKGQGVTHSAWGRTHTARGAFMIAKWDGAYKRVGPGRWDIRRLYGPSLQRELARHMPYVIAVQHATVEHVVMPEAYRQISLLVQKAKTTHGL